MGVSIRGTVRDGQGRALALVRVVAIHEPTGSMLAKVTGDDGGYCFEDVRAGGPYVLMASGKGLQTVEERLQLKTEQALDHDFTMERVSDDLTTSA